MSSNNSSGDDYEPAVLSDRRSIHNEENYKELSVGKISTCQGNYISEKDKILQQRQMSDDIRLKSQNCDYQNESLQVAQIYQSFMKNQVDDSRLSNGLDKIKYKFSSQFINQENSTPKSPSYLQFVPESIQVQQEENSNERLIHNFEQFSPISLIEDSRGDMTVQMFDLSITQNKELIQNMNYQINTNQSSLGKSSFNNQFIQINNQQNVQKYYSSSPHKIPPNSSQPPIQQISNKKNEIKSQKLRERLEKYSNQMMNNLNLQRGNSEIQQKTYIKSIQGSISKIFNINSIENKRIQAIKTSAKSSQVSTPIKSKNSLGEVKNEDICNNEQKREKSLNSYTKHTKSSQKKIEQSKREKNIQIYQQNVNLIQNMDFLKLQQSTKLSKQNYWQQQDDQQQMKQKKQIQSNNNNQQIIQAKFLLQSPQKCQTVSQNTQTYSNSSQKPSQFSKNSSNAQFQNRQRHSDVIIDHENEGNKQKQSRPPSDKKIFTNSNNSNYTSRESNKRQQSENMNDPQQKKHNSLEKIYKMDKLNQQISNEQIQATRFESQNYESQQEQNNNLKGKQENLKSSNIKRQQYNERNNNQFKQIDISNGNLQNDILNQQNDLEDSDLTNRDEDAFAINIYKIQFKQNTKQKLVNQEDEDRETCDIPQVYSINRPQGNHPHKIKEDCQQNENIWEENISKNFMKKSEVKENVLKSESYQTDLENERITNQINQEYNKQQTIIQDVESDNSFNQGSNNYYSNYNQSIRNQNSNSKISTNNINTKETCLQTDNSNFTTQTNGFSQVNQLTTLQSFKAVSSFKLIDQDGDEIQNQQFIKVFNSSKNEEQQKQNQNQNGELKIYDFSQKQSKKNIILEQKEQNDQQKIQCRVNKNVEISQDKNYSLINNLKTNNYLCNEIQPKRLSDQMDVRRKAESSQNKIRGNSSNEILNHNHPICLYNLHKDHKNRNSNKNNENNSYQKDSTPSKAKSYNQNSNQKVKQSPSFYESPIKVCDNLYNFGFQDQMQNRQNLNQSTKFIQQQINSNFFSLQQQKQKPTLPNDNQLYGSLPSNQVNKIFTSSTNQSSQNIITSQNQYNSTPSSPYKRNINNQQDIPYQQQFQQKQTGKIASQRELKYQKDKYIQKFNDFKNQQELEINDKAIQRKSSNGILRGSYKDGHGLYQQNNIRQGKSFQGNSATKRDSQTRNSSFNDNLQNQQNELKTLFDFFPEGNDMAVQINTKQNSQLVLVKTERAGRYESPLINLSTSQQSNTNIINKNAGQNSRKNSNKSNKDGSKYYYSESQIENQRKSSNPQKQQQVYFINNYTQNTVLADDYTINEEQQQKQAIQIHNTPGKCFDKYTVDNDNNSKVKNTESKVSINQEVSYKQLASSYDENTYYILKHLKEQQKLTSQAIVKNQNSSFNLNNKSLTSSAHRNTSQSKSQSKKTSKIPTATKKKSYSKYSQLIQEKNIMPSSIFKSSIEQNK